LWEGEDNILSLLDLYKLSREEAKEGEEKINPYILAGF
jgi:hypothetical protein